MSPTHVPCRRFLAISKIASHALHVWQPASRLYKPSNFSHFVIQLPGYLHISKLKYRVANVLRLASASSKIQTNPPAWSLSTFPWRITKTVELVEIWGSLITTAKSYSLRLRQCGAFSAICMLQACASHRLAPRSTIHSARLTTVWGENTLANFPFQVGCAPFLRLLT
jgi:hypothetical protein